MQSDIPDMPPKMFMMQILNDAAKTYVFLWEQKDDENRIFMAWKDLCKYYNRNNFRTSLRKLNSEGLLSYQESKAGITIELVGWDDI